MSKIERRTFGDFVDILTDYTANGSFESLKVNVKYYAENNYAVLVRTTDLEKNIFEPARFTDKKGYDFLKKTSLYGGEIVLANVGSVGKVYKVPFYDKPMTLAPNTYLVRFDSNIDNEYIFQFLKSPFYIKELYKNIGSTTLQAINKDNFRSINFFYHRLPQQRKIAEILSTCDDVIEKTEAAIAKYQALKQGMMHDLFTRGIDLKTGKLRPSYQDAPELYKECELGMIPKEWEKCTFKDISSVNQGLQIPISLRHKTEGVNRFVYITIQYLNDIENEANRYYIENPTTSVVCNEDDVLMVRTGNTGMIVTNIVGAFHNNFFKIDYGKNVVKEFLVYHLKRKSIQSIILNYAGTTTIPDLKHGDFYNLPFMMPSQIEQKIISTRLEGIDNKLQTEQSALAKYQQIKAGLMQDLLTGKVEVREESKKIAC